MTTCTTTFQLKDGCSFRLWNIKGAVPQQCLNLFQNTNWNMNGDWHSTLVLEWLRAIVAGDCMTPMKPRQLSKSGFHSTRSTETFSSATWFTFEGNSRPFSLQTDAYSRP